MTSKEKRESEERAAEYQAWRRSLDGIVYEASIINAANDDDSIVVSVLHALPDDIREKVVEEVSFVVAWASMPLPRDLLRPWVIILRFEDADTEQEKKTIIAHEIAHFILTDPADPMRGGKDAEIAADDLCEKWGFGRSYKSYEMFK